MPPSMKPEMPLRIVSCGMSPRKTLSNHHWSFCARVHVRVCSSVRCWRAMASIRHVHPTHAIRPDGMILTPTYYMVDCRSMNLELSPKASEIVDCAQSLLAAGGYNGF